MESLEKLRELACDINGNEIVDHMQIYPSCVFDGAWLDAWHRAFDKELEALEREIAERYILLPVDADGVPIHVGDEVCGYGYSNGGVVVKALNGHMIIVGRLEGGENYAKSGLLWSAKDTHHVKPRTVEDVLIEYRLKAYNLYLDYGLTSDERVAEFKSLDEEYASKLRMVDECSKR